MVGYDKMKEFCAHESKKNSWDWRLQWLSIISAFVSNSGRHADGKHCNCSLSRIDACLLSVSIEPMSYENGTKRSSGSIFVWWCLMVFRDFGAKAVSSLFSFEGIIYIYMWSLQESELPSVNTAGMEPCLRETVWGMFLSLSETVLHDDDHYDYSKKM